MPAPHPRDQRRLSRLALPLLRSVEALLTPIRGGRSILSGSRSVMDIASCPQH
jgi:hypothetical protein